jgi:hypothetical protein
MYSGENFVQNKVMSYRTINFFGGDTGCLNKEKQKHIKNLLELFIYTYIKRSVIHFEVLIFMNLSFRTVPKDRIPLCTCSNTGKEILY